MPKRQSSKVERICSFCRNKFLTWPCIVKNGGGKHCSWACRVRPFIERFQSLVVKHKTGCWEWLGSTNGTDGYGYIHDDDNKSVLAHRVSWVIHNGPIPKGLNVLHECDNPPCTRPSHLFLGTHADNMRDMFSKKRCSRTRGEKHHASKLTKTKVLEIRKRNARGMTCYRLSKDYHVSIPCVVAVVNRVTWKHV